MAEQEFDIIEQYLSDQLAGDALQSFERQMEEDPALRQEVTDRKAMRHFLLNIEKTRAFKTKLESLGAQHFNEDSTPQSEAKLAPPSPKRPWAFIIAILLGLAAAYFLYQWMNQPAPLPNYQQMALHEPLELVQKSNDPNSANIYELEQTYNRGNYAKALPLIEEYLQAEPNDQEMRIAQGVCLMELDQLADAGKIFQGVARGASIYRHTGTWYLAMSYLKIGNQEKMKEYLNQIPESSELYYSRAQQLLGK